MIKKWGVVVGTLAPYSSLVCKHTFQLKLDIFFVTVNGSILLYSTSIDIVITNFEAPAILTASPRICQFLLAK